MDCWQLGLGFSLLVVTGCPDASGGDEPATEASSGGASSSSSGAVFDGEAYCAQFTTSSECQGAISPEVTCSWSALVTFDSTCAALEQRSACLWVPFPGTDPGCVPPLTCPGDMFFREVEGGLEVIGQCGGSYVDGFEPCPASGAGDDEPYALPECNCACTESGTTTSTGG